MCHVNHNLLRYIDQPFVKYPNILQQLQQLLKIQQSLKFNPVRTVCFSLLRWSYTAVSEFNRQTLYVPSEPGSCCLCCWSCLPGMTPIQTACWEGRGWRRCWPCAPQTSSEDCCTAGWNARPGPAPPPGPPSADHPEDSSRSSLRGRRQMDVTDLHC